MSPRTQPHERTPSRRSLLSLLNPASYVPQRDNSKKNAVQSGAVGERAGNLSASDLNASKEDRSALKHTESLKPNMDTILPPGTQPTKIPPPVPLPHTSSTETTDSTSTTNTATLRPQLPSRPSIDGLAKSTSRPTTPPHRPSLTDRIATTQVSTLDIQTLSFPDGTRGTFDTTANTSSPSKGNSLFEYISRKTSRGAQPADIEEDKASITSLTPSSIQTRRFPGGITSPGSIFSGFGVSGSVDLTPAQRLLALQSSPTLPPFLASIPDHLRSFGSELDNLPDVEQNSASNESNEEVVLAQFRAKQKQYFILSSSGKPIWSRHGDLNLINGYIGVISTIISSFTSFTPPTPLHSFTAGSTLFVITNPRLGPLYLVGISRIAGEGVPQIEKQLDSLYQQILSTLTLPRLQQLFTHRPGTDLSRSLSGTEKLLASLCDTFTAGSVPSMLSALECLRLRKTHRQIISNTLLQHKTDKLLYGLIVAGGKLVSVLRPKRHSLHPGDLELIFNMLFPNGRKVGGEGENWVPVCLPGFNASGYLYLYVSFVPLSDVTSHKRGGSNENTPTRGDKSAESLGSRFSTASNGSPTKPSFPSTGTTPRSDEPSDDLAILLISPDRDAFFEMKSMRDSLVASLAKNGSLGHISKAVKLGRPGIPQLLLPLLTARDRRLGGEKVAMRHFIYKSRADVQFVQSKIDWGGDHDHDVDTGGEMLRHRRLMSIYAALHTSLHTRHTHPRIISEVTGEFVAMAWITTGMEFYAVAGRRGDGGLVGDGEGTRWEGKRGEEEVERLKGQLGREAERVVRWVERERERVFILGGAVF